MKSFDMEKAILVNLPVTSACADAAFDFDALVRDYGRFVLNVAYAVVRNPEDAEDVAQETFFRAFRAGNLGEIENMRSWLARIAWRLALNHRRSQEGRGRGIQTDELLPTLPAGDAGAEELLMSRERASLLDGALQSLPCELRETFILLAAEEMTSRDAAEILGIPESSVRNRLFRARKQIKEKLAVLLGKRS